MFPRVTYWTGTWDPAREAISKEVETLRRSGNRLEPVVAFSPGNRSALLPRQRVCRLSGRRWMTFRALAACLEPCGEITHAFGQMDGWHLFRSLGRRPFVYTVVIPGAPLAPALYERVRLFVAESESLAASLRAAGIADDRIRVIYPGVDLDVFSPAPLPSAPFRLLFASSPADASEFEDRGIGLLVALAQRHPDIEVVVLWREWGDVAGAARQLQALAPPPNFKLERRAGRQMADVYAGVHATACFFRESFGKSCPNSVVEGLACGRPALVSDTCGISALLSTRNAGVSAPRTLEGLSEALERLREDFEGHCRDARRLACDTFGLEGFLGEYAKAYEAVTA